MDNLLKLVAVITSAMFAGAAFYVFAVEHPARLEAEATAAISQFKSSYKRAAPIQVVFSAVCFLACFALWQRTHIWEWLAAGALVLAVIPYTLALILPVNRVLLAVDPPPGAIATLLLSRWGHLHTGRTILGLVGFVWILLQTVL
jgi:hypothetical protein